MKLALVFVLAQHLHTHSPPPLYVEPITVTPQTVTDNEVTRIPAAPVVVPSPVVAPIAESWFDRNPWWPFALGLLLWASIAAYRGRSKGLALPDRATLPPVYPSQDEVGPVPLARRSSEDCRTLYIDTVRAQVRAMIGRSDIRCVSVSSAPIEMKWRAWMGATDYTSAKPHHRATGRSEGAALKSLLAAHRQFGGDWIGFAVDRERAQLEPDRSPNSEGE